MHRFRKPFYRKDRDLWYVQLHGKQHALGRDKKEAFQQYHRLMQAPKPVESRLVVTLIDGFLDWTKTNRASETYNWYAKHLQSFIDSLADKNLATHQLKPFHVQLWADSHKTWGNSYKRGAIVAVQRVFLWAEKIGHIEHSPIRHVEKPRAESRDNPVTPADFAKMLAAVKDRAFRDLLQFSWESGTRPQEARLIEPRHVSIERRCVEFPPDEAKGKKRWRTIHLTDKALAIVARLLEHRKDGMLFRNMHGNPWKCFAICNRFARLKKKLGKQFAFYDLRHGFCQRLLEGGMDHLTVAALMGHVDGVMIAKVYSHMNKASGHLREELNRANSAS